MITRRSAKDDGDSVCFPRVTLDPSSVTRFQVARMAPSRAPGNGRTSRPVITATSDVRELVNVNAVKVFVRLIQNAEHVPRSRFSSSPSICT